MRNRKDVIDLLTSHSAVMIPLQGKTPRFDDWPNFMKFSSRRARSGEHRQHRRGAGRRVEGDRGCRH